MKHVFNWLFSFLLVIGISFQAKSQPQTNWPEQTIETKPGSRWWWMGSAVDEANLTYSLEAFANAGIGALEITPIYGVKGNEANDIQFLSDRWMQLYNHTKREAERLGIKIDMNTGTGWPFGGPDVTVNNAASRLFVVEFELKEGESLDTIIEVPDPRQKATAKLLRLMAFSDNGSVKDLTSKVVNQKLNWKAPKGTWRLIAAFSGNTFQQVKRAAPGGEGLVMDHFSSEAMEHYLGKFIEAFKNSDAPVPNNFFNDSYEAFQADWTPGLFEQFYARRGYKLENYLPLFLASERTDATARIISDYRETLSELLLENFVRKWSAWANEHGSKTRSQAHGSPGNLIDLYAAVDIPECEGFGLSEFNIRGLKKDPFTRPNDSDISMLKYASSAANISGKPLTSSETFTWLTEHFRTSFAQCKPDLDLMFVSGVNRMYFHGTTYSPVEAEWPGWKFYATIDMSPTNPLWRDAPAFTSYISRVQSFLQMGKPDNDFLLYLPVYDLWHQLDGRLLMFDIHRMYQRAPEFIKAVHQIIRYGYNVDYISDNFIRSSVVKDGKIITSGGTSYKALVIPSAKLMPEDVLLQILNLARQGATIVFIDEFPSDVPGFFSLESRRQKFEKIKNDLPTANFQQSQIFNLGKGRIIAGSDYYATLKLTGVLPESLKAQHGLHSIRRKNPDGHHYFISALKETDTDAWIPLSVKAKSAMLFDPVTGDKGKAKIKHLDGKTHVRLQLRSGESVILKTFENIDVNESKWNYYNEFGAPLDLNNDWALRFSESTPPIHETFVLEKVGPWTNLDLPDVKINMGTGVYKKTFTVDDKYKADNWILDLGDVRETARVRINGRDVATLWSVPYRVMVGEYLLNGNNTIEIEVTSLPANRIAELDRQGVEWRIFKDINFVDIHYRRTGYGHWETSPAGLNSDVRLIPVRYEQ